MKTIQTKTAAVLLVVAGTIFPASAQRRGEDHGRDRNDRPAQQQFRQQESRPQYQQQGRQFGQQQAGRGWGQGQPQYQQQYQQPQRNREAYRPSQSYQQPQYRQQENYRNNYYNGGNAYRQQYNAPNWQNNRGYSYQDRGGFRGGYRGNYIPRERFYSSFGREHFFRLGRPAYYGGYPWYRYGGYSFRILDPLPEYWGPDWYDNDDVYVDYQDDGYYLYNRRYPGAGISVDIEF